MSNNNKDESEQFHKVLSLPSLGSPFPKMEVHTTQGKMTLPDHFKGKWFVLFSHPADFTPVCTTEFVSFTKHQKDFKKIGVELIGHSIDQVFSHIKWLQWIRENLDVDPKFPIIADDQGRIAQKLGMIHEGMGTHTVRAVFIVDPKGILRLMIYYPQEIGRNMSEILRVAKALQIAQNQKVAMPANWPANELIGDHVIIPPPRTEKDANARMGKKDCYDWWFCHKELDSKKRTA